MSSNHIAAISIRLNPTLQYKRAVMFVQSIQLTFSENSRSRQLSLDMESYCCIFCSEEVSSRQKALLCDGCERWQHRRCQTANTPIWNKGRLEILRFYGDSH